MLYGVNISTWSVVRVNTLLPLREELKTGVSLLPLSMKQFIIVRAAAFFITQ